MTADVIEFCPQRPKTRADCINGPRPCPWVGCRHHLYLDVNPETGKIKINSADPQGSGPWNMIETCALDLADRGGVTLEEIAVYLHVTRERIRQVEMECLSKIKRSSIRRAHLADFVHVHLLPEPESAWNRASP